MTDDLVARVDKGMCSVLFQLPDFSDELAIDIMYGFLETIGVRATRPQAMGRWYPVAHGMMYAHLTREQVATEDFGGTFIDMRRENEDKGPITVKLIGHTSSEMHDKINRLAPVLHGYLTRRVRESIPPPPPDA